ncbi:hypothetical protein [Ascidiimonas sp. W6]|uniref:hypothetical protein n=1 Tax=Ascidiimonas meishanensis TaxID=3128903 RepID=UPI0030EC6B80
METIKLELTLDETNTILAGLGQQPYIKVVDLVQKIQQQGASQLKTSASENPIENQRELENTRSKKDGK